MFLEVKINLLLSNSCSFNNLILIFLNLCFWKDSDSQSEDRSPTREGKYAKVSDQESQWRVDASDYELRFCGHCNTTTDIKEANFFGR